MVERELESKLEEIGPKFLPPSVNVMTSQQKVMDLTKVRRLSRQYSAEFGNGRITIVGTKGSDKNKIMLTMAWHNSVSWCSRAAIILILVSLVLNIIAFVSPYWMLVVDAMGTSYSGLWKVCIFQVCGDFLHHSMFLWFHVVQAMMCFGLLGQLLSLTFTIIYVAATGQSKTKKLLITAALSAMLFAVMTSFVGVTLYGIKQGQRSFDTLSWGFLIASVASFVMILSVAPLGLEMKNTFKKTCPDQAAILSKIEGSESISRPALRHSPSVDSCVALRTDENLNDRQIKLTRPRSESEVRLRVNSVSQDCPPTPLPGEIEEEECGGVFDNGCFEL